MHSVQQEIEKNEEGLWQSCRELFEMQYPDTEEMERVLYSSFKQQFP